MDFSLLDTFITVVHAGTVKKAADLLNSSSSSLYRRLEQIEKETGIVLFDNNKTSLTPAGKLFYEKVCTMKGIYDHACSDALLVQNTDKLPSVLNVATSLMYPALYMMDQLEMLISNHAKTKLHLKTIPDTISTQEELISALTDNDIHCLCIPNGLKHSTKTYGFYQIGYTCLCLQVPPGNELYGQEYISINDIQNQSIVMPAQGSDPSYDQIMDIILNGNQNTIIPRTGYVNINTINACVENNWLLLGFEAWRDSFPTMKMTKLRERYPCPYGILYKKDHFVSK